MLIMPVEVLGILINLATLHGPLGVLYSEIKLELVIALDHQFPTALKL
jgi:hypothetical protein